jgi:hypothetical protein
VFGAEPVEDADRAGAGATGPSFAAATEAAGAAPFRFSRMGPKGTAPGKPARVKLAVAMTAGGGGPSGIPSGYTYLGQFIDHDLTSDRTKVLLGHNVSPAELLQARSPSLDLDSLYGAGPQQPGSAKFYSDDRHLKTGKTAAAGGDAAKAGFDLPRAGTGSSRKAKRTAVIPDFRNDENLAVAQTHLAFIRFHNRVVDSLPASVPAAQRFVRAREIVVKHFQWMIRHDYLPRICAAGVLDDVFTHGRKVFESHAGATQVPTMPVEFSVAAFRLGHSMIRRAYDWNARFPDGQGTLDFLFAFSGTGGDLGGGLRLPSNWIADFRRLYDFGEAGRADLTVPAAQFNRAMRIDTALVNPLKNLPTGSFGGPAVAHNDPIANLAFRNLTRAKMLRLASGQKMVGLLRSRGVTVKALTKPQLRNGDGGASLADLTVTQRNALLTNTPLWFYVLREAELNNGKLKGVGARIVGETFHRAMQGSTFSIVRDASWRPTLGPDSSTFRMVDLLLFAFEGKKSLLAPLG